MKKLGLSLIAAAGMFFFTQNINAQVEPEEQGLETAQEAQQQHPEFREVDVVALPQAVKDAVMSDHTGATTEQAWVKQKDGKTVYKLSLNSEGQKEKLYIDAEGNWIDKDDKKDRDKDYDDYR